MYSAPLAWSVNQLAARAIAMAEHLSLEVRRELLDMAGLIGPDGDVAPDDHTQYDLFNRFVDFDEEYAGGRMAATDLPPDDPTKFTSPPTLRTLGPRVPTRRPHCGSKTGWQDHRRHGEPACQPCKDGTTAYSIELRNRNRAAAGGNR